MKRHKIASHLRAPFSACARLMAWVGLLALLATPGCATSMSYSTFPQTLAPGEVAGSLAGQLTLNSNALDSAITTLRIADYRTRNRDTGNLSEAEFRELLDSAVTFALFQPTIVGEVALRVGVWEGVDVGIRCNSTMTKGDIKTRLWQSEDARSLLSVTTGVGYAGNLGPADLKFLTWQEFSRLDAELGVMYGYQPANYMRVYAGPRMIHSWLTVEPALSQELEEQIPQEFRDYRPDQFFHDENILYLGATLGVMLGYEWIWVHLEATVMYTLFEPVILDKTRNLSGITVAPVAGISVEF